MVPQIRLRRPDTRPQRPLQGTSALRREVFEDFFRRSIDLCREAGLLEEGPVYVDSTLIQASAAVDSMVPKEDRVQPPLSIEEYVQRLYTENDSPPVDEGPPPPEPPSRRRRRGGR